MDEVLFHFTQRLETLQIWVYGVAERLLERIDGDVVAVAQDRAAVALRRGAEALHGCAEACKSLLSSAAAPRLFVQRFVHLVRTDMPNASLYAGCVGFTLGGTIGILIGMYLRSGQQPVAVMKAIAATSYTQPDCVALLEDVPVPRVNSCTDVVIRVVCATLDHTDLKVAQGYCSAFRRQAARYNSNVRSDLPLTLGRGGSGIVVEVGRGVDLEVGDRVMFVSPAWQPGTLALYTALPRDLVMRLPSRLSFEGGASVAYSGCVAYHAVTSSARLTQANAHTKSVLVHCGGTPPGPMLAQMASTLGAKVSVTCLNRASPVMKALGAATVLPLEAVDTQHALENTRFDVVFNTVLSDRELAASVGRAGFMKRCSDSLLVTTVVAPPPSDTFGFPLNIVYSIYTRLLYGVLGADPWRDEAVSQTSLKEVARLAEAGRIQPVIDKVFRAYDVDAALAHLTSANALGATVISFSSGRRGDKSEAPLDRPDLLR